MDTTTRGKGSQGSAAVKRAGLEKLPSGRFMDCFLKGFGVLFGFVQGPVHTSPRNGW